jgi:hypothetical protein
MERAGGQRPPASDRRRVPVRVALGLLLGISGLVVASFANPLEDLQLLGIGLVVLGFAVGLSDPSARAVVREIAITAEGRSKAEGRANRGAGKDREW